MTVAKVLKEAKKLDADERRMLVKKILVSIEEDGDGPISVETKGELARRLDALRKNPDDGMEWSDFRKQLRKEMKQLRRKRA